MLRHIDNNSNEPYQCTNATLHHIKDKHFSFPKFLKLCNIARQRFRYRPLQYLLLPTTCKKANSQNNKHDIPRRRQTNNDRHNTTISSANPQWQSRNNLPRIKWTQKSLDLCATTTSMLVECKHNWRGLKSATEFEVAPVPSYLSYLHICELGAGWRVRICQVAAID